MNRLTVLRLLLVVTLLLIVTGNPGFVHASPPQDDLTPGYILAPPTIAGVASTAIACLATGAIATEIGALTGACPASGTVELSWQGDVESARLVLSIPDTAAAPGAAHAIRVNGQTAVHAPVCSSQQPCVDGEYFYLSIPLERVVQGENKIEITDDARPGDSWMVTNVRLEVRWSVGPVRDATAPSSVTDLTLGTPFVITFVNPYDGTDQEAMAQVPDAYDPDTPTPLLVFAHWRSGTMENGPDSFGTAANDKGWLLVSPQLHGSWPIPPECFIYGNDCDYDDQVLAGTTSPEAEPRPGAFAHASLESQYDLVGATKYMVDHYNVKTDQIYLIGGSMGGQATSVTAARFPHLFAAAYSYMGISNLGQWYWQRDSYYDRRTLEKECHVSGDLKSPTENPFCYQQRSSTEFGRNYINTPISLTHSIYDELVPISHSRNLRDAINGFGPEYPVTLYEERASGWLCDPPYHCLKPDSGAVLRYLDDYRLNRNPTHIRIAADESKLFYWMNVDQISGARWSYVDVTRDPDSPTVEVTTNDTSALRIGLNLGTGWLPGKVVSQPGMGLPATTYLLKGAGYFKLVDYTSGYLTTRVNTTGLSTFTLSALDVNVTAVPAVIPDDGQSHDSTITIQVRDSSEQASPVPNDTEVQLRTTEGRFANGQKTLTLTTLNGQATATLTVDPKDNLAEITATVGQATGTATVNIVKPAIRLELTPASQTAYAGVPFNMDYRVTNTGDVPLSSVAVTDDNGGGGQITVCQGRTLAPGASTTCQRPITLYSSTTVHAQVSGQVSPGDIITDNAFVSITVIAPSIGLLGRPNPLFLHAGESGNLTYQVTNTGNTVLTSVSIQDDNGNGGSTTVCSGITLQPGATETCVRPIEPTQASTVTATATGLDPLDNEISGQTQTLVVVGEHVFLPYIAYRR